MGGGVRLDLDPSKNFPTRIERSENKDAGIEGYDSYKYTAKYDGSFYLSALLYNGNLLPGLLSYDVPVKVVVTYFKEKENKPLLIHLENSTHTYYFNPDIKEQPQNVIFTEFVSKEKKAFETKDLKGILQSIDNNHGFNLVQFGKTNGDIAKKLLGQVGIIFDLGETKHNKQYKSDITNEKITVTEYKKIASTYPKVEHVLSTNPFYIKGLKLPNGEYVNVKGGFPNDPLIEFMVYYGNINYDDPYLITLKISSFGFNVVPSKYYLTKNGKNSNGKWDIRRVGSYINEDGIRDTLRDILMNYHLKLESVPGDLKHKLGDLSKGFSINLTITTGSTTRNDLYYDSDEIRIRYKKEDKVVESYWKVRHAYGIHSFSVKNIQITTSYSIGINELPPPGTLFGLFNAYYKHQEYKDPVLIELVCTYNSANTLAYAYYYCKEEGKWQGYLISTDAKSAEKDIKQVIEHVSKNDNKIVPSKLGQSLENKLVKYPDVALNVTIDFYQSDSSTYTPKDSNGTEFTVKMTMVGSNFHKFRQIAQNNARFKVESVIHDQRSLSIKTSYSITSLSAYYFGRSLSYDDLILVQLGEDKKYYQWNAGDIWSTTKESGRAEEILQKEVCRRKQGDVLDLKRTNGEAYPCLGCGNMIKLESTEASENKFTKYKHYLSSGKLSISGFLNNTTLQNGLPSAKDLSAVYVYWYTNDKEPKPLLVFYDCATDTEDRWYKKIGNDTWEEVHDAAKKPSNENEKDKIKKLLLDSNSPSVVINLKKRDTEKESNEGTPGEYSDPGNSGNKIKVTAENFEADKGEAGEQGATEGKAEYKKYTHKVKDKTHFKLSYLRHGGNRLDDIKTTELLEEIEVYYWVGDTAFDKPLVLMLTIDKVSTREYEYWERSKNSTKSWQKVSTDAENNTSEMEYKKLKEKLDKLRKEYFPPSNTNVIIGGTGALGFGGYKLWLALATRM